VRSILFTVSEFSDMLWSFGSVMIQLVIDGTQGSLTFWIDVSEKPNKQTNKQKKKKNKKPTGETNFTIYLAVMPNDLKPLNRP
jgi:hypothetical protein